ncbi:MAG: DUF4350 domain-containing protein [Candidatus Azobacteroides sp.]|nr:DUF4350 domain-containing protein [Candidatus Azobacteroides sp.]
MKKKIIYIVCIAGLFLLLYWNNNGVPNQFTWNPTYSINDKQPFGAYALDELLKTSWEKGYTHTYQKISDLVADTTFDNKNLLIITEAFYTTEEDIEELLNYVKRGGNAIIAATSITQDLRDQLNFHSNYDFLSDISENLSMNEKYSLFRFYSAGNQSKAYKVPVSISPCFFTCSYKNAAYKDSVYIVAERDSGKIVMLRYNMRKGNLILSCNPKIFTNYGVLNDSCNMIIRNTLAYLQDKPLVRTEYYQAGAHPGESQSPFRYLLSIRSLKWAFYIALITIGIFMIFTAKRKQKIIPVVKPPSNKMLEFVRSIATLYIRKNNNADIILKKYIYWADDLKRNDGIDIINEKHDRDFFERFASKTGKTVEEVSNLFRKLDVIDEKTNVTDTQMIELINNMK